jgi:hypothetical protein
MAELLICDGCWDRRWDALNAHRCSPRPQTSCDCPCVDRRHSDLGTFDLDHDRGIRGLTSPFGDDHFA